eukprot:CAMPEP_0181473348 /NCGR_PEP_ID=MMETSP1110-20121109/40076_1 /TAXON_ID=174948 /ORGANISM="Symbiodinium sp., Strain CCMP421" /LENGTH=170 /DNA_ID=CAMNT_0023598459 /DNA_START=411 /DNA_END=923 /DNA_ORIENTATION=-
MAPHLPRLHRALPIKEPMVFCELQQAVQKYPGIRVGLEQQIEAVAPNNVVDAAAHLFREAVIVTAAPGQDHGIRRGICLGGLFAKHEEVLHGAIAPAPGAAVALVDVPGPGVPNRLQPPPVPGELRRDDHQQVIMLEPGGVSGFFSHQGGPVPHVPDTSASIYGNLHGGA